MFKEVEKAHVKLKSLSALQSYFAAQWPVLIAVFRGAMQMLKRSKTCFGCLYRIRLELMQRWVLKMLIVLVRSVLLGDDSVSEQEQWLSKYYTIQSFRQYVCYLSCTLYRHTNRKVDGHSSID